MPKNVQDNLISSFFWRKSIVLVASDIDGIRDRADYLWHG